MLPVRSALCNHQGPPKQGKECSPPTPVGSSGQCLSSAEQMRQHPAGIREASMLAKEASMLAHGGIPVEFGGKLSCM